MSFSMKREDYAQLYGPTAGDSLRLGDTELFARVERDLTVYGQEEVFAGGKVVRDGMGMNNTETREGNPRVVDTVISNVVIIDYTGVYKADIGIRDGKILAIGKGGNPDHMDRCDFVVGVSTEAINGAGLICTAGGIDTHVHYITPEVAAAGLDGGVTTLFGGGTGPANGTRSATTSPGRAHIHAGLLAWDDVPVNVGIMAKGQGAYPELVGEQVRAGAAGIKTHEDWGATWSAIDVSLRAADEYDVQLAVHTDSLNEGGYVDHTLAAFKGRTIHTFHTEGAGGGHAPDVMVVCGRKNVLPSSTNPTNPYTANVIDELFDMTMVCHSLNPGVPQDVAFAESRVRRQTVAAEDVLQDMGAISMMSSDAMAMGRVGEVVRRSWQLASKMKVQRGPLPGDSEHDDNNRIRRYVAKYTINPAVTNGVADYIGSVEAGKYADLVLWLPALFGCKPEMVLKCGMVAWGTMGDAASSLPTPQPCRMTPLFGATGKATGRFSLAFTSRYAWEHGVAGELGLCKTVLPVGNTRSLSKYDMRLNDYLPASIAVDPETFVVTVDGAPVTCDAAPTTPLAQRYYFY